MIEGRTREAPWMGGATLNNWRSRGQSRPWFSVDARLLYYWSKRALDFGLALFGLVFLSPVLAAIGIAIRMDSPGPVIFAQERLGKDGRPFTLYKFRSMRHNHGKEQAHRAYTRDYVNGHNGHDKVFKPANGDVVTRVGQFLRKTSLDELPQLWNILKGEMSFVGPRPLVAYGLRDEDGGTLAASATGGPAGAHRAGSGEWTKPSDLQRDCAPGYLLHRAQYPLV